MLKIFKASGMLALLVCVMIAGCRKEEFDKFYARPAGLAKPIYQQLDSMGNFKNFLVCIEKAGYKNTLGSAGSWTVFAPTDEAFTAFMAENNITNINNISDSLAIQIVRTAMIYDGEKIDKLKDNFTKAGFVEDVAFRRRTVYYDFVETSDTPIPGFKSRKYISTNRSAGVAYVPSENNNKHITYFFQSYMDTRGLGAPDYNAFYPQSNYTGLNVGPAEIDPVKHDIIAENGVIHVVNKVLLPVKNIDQYLKGKAEYSVFKSILDGFATYTYNEAVSHQYKVLTGNSDSVFTKSYSDIKLALNNENFDKEDPNDAQVNNNSITVPTNTAVEEYANNVLLKYYAAGTKVTDLLKLNKEVLVEYVNSHLYNGQLWPSKFNTQKNILGESPKINSSNIVETKLLSNGAFYGVNKSQRADVFHTVYGNVLLDPKYSLMSKALQLEGYNLTLKIPTIRYMLIMVPDQVLLDLGFSYDTYYPTDPIRYTEPGTTTMVSGRARLRRIIQQQIVPLEAYPIPSLSGTGILETLNGDYIRYDNGHLISRGTLDNALKTGPTYANITNTEIGTPNGSGPLNGIAVYADYPMTYSERPIGDILDEMVNNNSAHPYYKFLQYLKGSAAMYSTSKKEITGVSVGVNYTILIPDNNAITAAVSAGLLPSSTAPTDPLQKDQVTRFLKYHILKNTFAVDGKKKGAFETLYKDFNDDVVVVTVKDNTTTSVTLKDATATREIHTRLSDSNKLGDRILIHSLDSYLDYRNN